MPSTIAMNKNALWGIPSCWLLLFLLRTATGVLGQEDVCEEGSCQRGFVQSSVLIHRNVLGGCYERCVLSSIVPVWIALLYFECGPCASDETTAVPTSSPTVVLDLQTPTSKPTPTPDTIPTALGWNRLGNSIVGDAPGDAFGLDLALSSDGTVVAVGAYLNDNNGLGAGQVAVYQLNDHSNDWVQLGQTLYGKAPGDGFGVAVAIASPNNGDWILAAGAFGNDDNGGASGQAVVFSYNDDTSRWIQLGDSISGVGGNDLFGNAVALSSDGRVLAVGGRRNDDNGIDSGHVRIFQIKTNDDGTSTWTQMGQTLVGMAAGDELGVRVSLSSDGTVVALGANEDDNENGADAGEAVVYRYESRSKTWIQVGQRIPGVGAGDRFGVAIALSSDGTVLAVGADANDDNYTNAGHVLVFDLVENTWIKRGQTLVGIAANDAFGVSVSMSSDGMIVAVGAWQNDHSSSNAGQVVVFEYDSRFNIWIQLGQTLEGATLDDFFGFVSLSSDGSILAVGAPTDIDDYNVGHVSVYKHYQT